MAQLLPFLPGEELSQRHRVAKGNTHAASLTLSRQLLQKSPVAAHQPGTGDLIEVNFDP
jgi:hypothetical protein